MGVERNIDSRKHRKSTHLASADLDGLELEGKSLIFTIEDVRYETNVDVSGQKNDGYFAKIKGFSKEWMINSKNRATISELARARGFKGKDSYNIGNWVGIRVELFVDRDVKMMGKTVDGVRVKPLEPKEKVKAAFSEANFEAAHKAKATIDMIKKSYTITTEIEKKYLAYGK